MRPNLRAVLITAFAFAFGPIPALMDDEIYNPIIIGTDPGSGLPIALVTGDWVTLQEVGSNPPAYMGASTRNFRGYKTPFQVPILQQFTYTGDFTQFQLLVGSDGTFAIRDAQFFMFFTHAQCSAHKTTPWRCFSTTGSQQIWPTENATYNFYLETASGNHFFIKLTDTDEYITWANSYDGYSYGISGDIADAQQFEFLVQGRNDFRAQSDMGDIEFLTPTQVGGDLTITNATATQTTLYNKSKFNATLLGGISFETTDVVGWQHEDSWTEGVTLNVKFSVPVPYVSSITLGLQFSHTGTDITQKSTSKSTTISDTVSVSVPGNSCVRVTIISYTAHDLIPWKAYANRTLLDREGFALRDTNGNIIPAGRFRVQGEVNVENYITYDSTVSNATSVKEKV